MVLPLLLILAVAALAVLLFVPALIVNIALFRILTNPVVNILVIIRLVLFVLKKLGLLNKLKAMVRL